MLDILNQQSKAILRLFKSYIETGKYEINSSLVLKTDENTIQRLLEAGITVDNLKELPRSGLVDDIIDMYGKDGEKWNKTFHKSFSTIRDTDISVLIAQQIMHYFTTYGLESLELYNKDLVYIPHEDLEIPELEEDVPLTVIHFITPEELSERLLMLLKSGIALSEQTVEDIMCLSDFIDKTKFDEIKNREVRIALYDKYDVVPSRNEEFIRYLIYKTIGTTMIIKNKVTIESIKDCDLNVAYNLFKLYTDSKKGYENLAAIFLRYKDIILAYKHIDEGSSKQKKLNAIINRIAKLSKTYHTPLEPNILDHLEAINNNDIYEQVEDDLISQLDNITIFRQIRILNTLKYRLNTSNDCTVYKIRNGKGYAKQTKPLRTIQKRTLNKVYTLIRNNLILKLENIVKDKNIYIPDNICYMAPQSEKQFNGNIPEGSFIECEREDDMVLGIQWKNLPYDRVDLDLHMQNKSEQYGWNSSYRSESSNFYFSGDITDAPNGATELFYIGKSASDKNFLLTVNDFTSNKEVVPFQFMIAKTKESHIDRNYMVDPNDILVQVENSFEPEENKKTLGLVKIDSKSVKFFFKDLSLGTSIVSRRNEVSTWVYSYLEEYSNYQISLNEILAEAGANLVNTPYIEELIEVETKNSDTNETEILYKKVKKPVDVDLSLENITKDSIIKLLTEVK